MVEVSRVAPGLVQVAGIQSPGLTASPGIAERVKDLLKQSGLPLLEKTDWHPGIPRMERTRDHAAWEIDALAARNPGYAHMVCRCESVSEAEVVEAIRKGHLTLDGIKYYTRAGMGRCQGGFCTYRIMQIIARETGLPLESITKHGPGSELVLGRVSGSGGPSGPAAPPAGTAP
jgi:glycerol-3-phosphate dehydrogenase